MAKLERSTTETKTEETEVTADYCFGRAAQALDSSGDPKKDNYVANQQGGCELFSTATAREWRELGLAIHSVNSALQ